MGDYLPRTDHGLLDWSSNFSTILTAQPVALGMTAANALLYSQKQTAFADAYAHAATMR